MQKEKTPIRSKKDEREVSDDDIKFALFGGDGEITDEMYDEVKRFSEDNNIPVISFPLPITGSMAIQVNPEKCYIGIDEEIIAEKRDKCVLLAHKLGHCMTGAFYNKYAACNIRKKHENKADIWAIKHKLSADDLDNAIADGYIEI